MEQIALLESGLANKAINIDNQLNNQNEIGDLMFQEFNPLSFNQILADLTSGNLGIMPDDCRNALLSQLSNILQSSIEVNEDLMNWFNELSGDEQIIAYNLLNNIVYLANDFQSENQKTNTTNTQDNNQQIAQKVFNITNSSIFLDNNKEIQKLFAIIERNKNEINSMLKDVMELSKENSIQASDKNNKDMNYKFDSKTINLQSNLLPNSLPYFNKTSFSDYADQDFEVKMLDLNQLQMNSNNISNESKVDNKLLDNKQELQNLFANKDLASEFGKLIIKNLKLPNGDSETKIQLQPKELGQVNVKLSTHNGQISAQIIAETMVGKELLESQIHQLKNSLTMLGFQVEKIDVQQITPTSTNQNASSQSQYNSNFGFSEQQASQQQKYEQDNINYLKSNFVEDEEVLNDIYNVSAIDYTV